MSHKPILAPSILSADFSQLGSQITEVESIGADWIHIDVMDGHFVPNLSMGPEVVQACRKTTSLPLDVHLMIENPEKFLGSFKNAGASGLTIHAEACQDLKGIIETIQELGCTAGVAINPDTPAEEIQHVIPILDLVLVMTVHPGFSGQSFIASALSKVTQIREWLDEENPEAVIEVDGGVDAETIPEALEAGAQVFVAGNAIFKHPKGIAAGVNAIKSNF